MIASSTNEKDFFQEKNIPVTERVIKAILNRLYKEDSVDLELEYRKLLGSYDQTIQDLTMMATSYSSDTGSISPSMRKAVMDIINQKTNIQQKKEGLLDKIAKLRNTQNDKPKKDVSKTDLFDH